VLSISFVLGTLGFGLHHGSDWDHIAGPIVRLAKSRELRVIGRHFGSEVEPEQPMEQRCEVLRIAHGHELHA
jgi:hypothetical protein